MAYSTSNPPTLMTQAIAGVRIWHYSSADNAAARRVAGYISDGFDLGMKKGDIVYGHDTDDDAVHLHVVNNTPSSTTAPDLTDGLAVGTTDTD